MLQMESVISSPHPRSRLQVLDHLQAVVNLPPVGTKKSFRLLHKILNNHMVLPIRSSVSEDVVTLNMAKCQIPSPKDPRSEFKSWQDFEVWVSQLKNLKPLQTKNTLFQILFIFLPFHQNGGGAKKRSKELAAAKFYGNR